MIWRWIKDTVMLKERTCRERSCLVCSSFDVFLGNGMAELSYKPSFPSSVSKRFTGANLFPEVRFIVGVILLTEIIAV